MREQSIAGKVGKFNVCFRDVTLSSHAGLALLNDFARQLGVAQVLDEELHVTQRERGYCESEVVVIFWSGIFPAYSSHSLRSRR